MENKKKCKACLEEKELCEFYKNKAFKSGLHSKCKVCVKGKISIVKIFPKGTKKCNSCFVEKTFDKYRKNHGLETYRSQCNKCQRDGIKVPKKESVISDYKVCYKCEIEKHIDDFHNTKKRNGEITKAGYCKECLNKTYRQEKRQCSICLEDKTLNMFSDEIYCKKCNKKEKADSIIVKTIECSNCKVFKAKNLFPKNSLKWLGVENTCKECKPKKLKKEYVRKGIMLPASKQCSKCRLTKPINDFCKDGNRFRAECKVCKKIYNSKSKELIREASKKYRKYRVMKDPSYKLKNTLRGLIIQALKKKNLNKSKSTNKIVGCTLGEFRQHIEKQFLNWMTWENYGNVCGKDPDYNCSWDLDHIIPISTAKTEEEIYLLNHWSNFQPLCSKVNRWEKKGVVYACSNIELGTTYL